MARGDLSIDEIMAILPVTTGRIAEMTAGRSPIDCARPRQRTPGRSMTSSPTCGPATTSSAATCCGSWQRSRRLAARESTRLAGEDRLSRVGVRARVRGVQGPAGRASRGARVSAARCLGAHGEGDRAGGRAGRAQRAVLRVVDGRPRAGAHATHGPHPRGARPADGLNVGRACAPTSSSRRPDVHGRMRARMPRRRTPAARARDWSGRCRSGSGGRCRGGRPGRGGRRRATRTRSRHRARRSGCRRRGRSPATSSQAAPLREIIDLRPSRLAASSSSAEPIPSRKNDRYQVSDPTRCRSVSMIEP